MKVTNVVDVRLVVQVRHSHGRPELDRADLDYLASTLRDHRSLDGFIVTVVEETEDLCSFCGRRWEEADEQYLRSFPEDEAILGLPLCCHEAQAEFWRGHKCEVCAED